jgi:hypothetical protein
MFVEKRDERDSWAFLGARSAWEGRTDEKILEYEGGRVKEWGTIAE